MNRTSIVGVIIVTITLVTAASEAPFLFSQHQAVAFRAEDGSRTKTITKAPIAISGNNLYVTWWTNDTAKGDGEVMFRASTDGGKTFGNKINLSNNSKTNSVDAEIAASGNDVVVSWWERDKTTNEPVLRISNDNGKTFGPVLKLASNGTIGSEGQ